MAIVFGLILLGVVFFALLTYGFFWYETANGPYLSQLQEKSQGHPGRWVLRGILTSLASLLVVVLCFPLQFWRSLWRPTQEPNPGRPPIFLVHGLFHNTSAWVFYRWWLRRAGYSDVYAFSYNSLTEVFDDIQPRFDQWVEEIMNERHPGQQAVMIGHSLGGLIIRAHLGNPATARRVAAVVTLGTPYQGSKLGALGISALARSIIYQSPLCQRLEQLPPPLEIKRLAMISPVDNMVLPQVALRTAHSGWKYLETPPISHVSMLYHLATARLVLRFLSTG